MKYQKLLTIIAWFVSTNTLYAQPNSDSEAFSVDSTAETTQALNDERFAGWTEEQFQAYDDSIITSLYPAVVKCHPSPTDIQIIPNEPKDSLTGDRFAGDNNHVPNNVIISTSKAAGEIPIQSGTTQTGARTYTIPISVYPGMHGHQPELALVYNSQQGNSVLGMGWSISGLSSIERTGKTRYYDDKPEGAVMDNTDAFVLDGVHMIKIRTTSSYILYQSEVGNIKAKGYYSGDVMKYFEVFYPNGNRAYYGSIYNSNTNYLSYPVYYLYDIHDNMISYQYSYQNYNFRITSISYNGASISFNYTDSRPDPITSYSAGAKKYQTYLLNTITCKFGTNVLGTYSLTYSTEYNRSLLTQIDYFAENQFFNPLKFYYGDGAYSSTFHSERTVLVPRLTPIGTSQLKVVRNKCHYRNSEEGLITVANTNPYFLCYRPYSIGHHTQHYFANLYHEDDIIVIYPSIDRAVALGDTIQTGVGFIDVFSTDLKGEQEENIIKVNNVVAGGYDQVTFHVYECSFTETPIESYTRTYQFNTVLSDPSNNKSIQPKFYYPGDFNGDGKIEILAVSAHQPMGDTTKPSTCYLFDLENDSILYQGHVMSYKVEFIGTEQVNADSAYNHTDRLFPLDYDGDGKTDLCHINENGTNIYTFDVSNDTLTARLVGTYTGLKKVGLANHVFLPGEYNGDGLTDILVSPVLDGLTTTWNIYNSKGNGQFDNTTTTGPAYNSYANGGFITQDVNSDGLSDLVQYSSTYFSTYLNNGNSIGTISSYNGFPQNNSVLIPVDINSHNRYESLLCIRDTFITRYSFSRDDGKELMMTGMANSLGVIEKNEYRSLNEKDVYAPFYHQTYFPSFPFVNISEPVNVLTSSVTMHNYTELDRNSYYYQDAILHRLGLGFCGFKTVTHYDRRGRAFVQTYDPQNYGVLKGVVTPDMTQTLTYSILRLNNKTMKIRLTNKVENNLLNGNTVNTAYSYDTYNNPTQVLATYPDGSTIKTNNTYINNSTIGNNYYLGFPIGQKTTTTLSNGNSSSKEYYIPASIKMLPTNKVYKIDGYLVKQEDYTYDYHGNMTSVMEKPYSSDNTLQTTYSYDSYGRKTQETDCFGLTTYYSYNAKGRLASQTDGRGNMTTFSYDAFGRDSLTINPDSTLRKISYLWDGIVNAHYAIREQQTGKPATTTVYDALGREIASRVVRFNGLESEISKQYDVNGRLERVSLPHTGSTPAGWNVYTYDDNDRVTSYTEATGKVTATSYSGNSVTTTENGRTTTRTYDPRGNLISVTDPGGTITYNLAPDGQPVSIVAPGGTTTFAYDMFRRRYSIYDPSAGYTHYSYDAAGNLSGEANNQWQSKNYTYDSYNRLIGVSTTEFSSIYTYNNYNELVSVTSDNATSRTYTYDNYGRLVSCRETAPYDVWLQKDFSYREGNIDTVRYTSYTGLSVFEKRIYTNGYLSESKLNGTTAIYRLISENAFGQPTTIFTGGLQRNYTFTSLGVPTGRSTQFGSNAVFDESYTFDNDMNLLSRTDNKRNLTEQFTYDNLGRLTSYGGNTVTYSDNGNMTTRSDVGTMFYTNTAKPYAISGITPVNNAVPMRNQTITYTSFGRPYMLQEGYNYAYFIYNCEMKRVMMETSDGGNHARHFYLGDCYEWVTGDLIPSTERIYLMGDYYDACAVYVKTGTTEETRYIIRDYLGSIRAVSNYFGSSYNEYSYDAWGRMRNPADWHVYAPDSVPTLELGRGFTGHEHLSQFGLINMNARLYDPAVGRFLSPDPYVQMPDFTQNFNRYSYALNNPLKYMDESGEILGLIGGFIRGLWKAITKGDFLAPFKEGWKGFKLDLKIAGGLFIGNFKQIVSRFTWESFQTFAGLLFSEYKMLFHDVESVEYYDGATYVLNKNTKNRRGITIGNFININDTKNLPYDINGNFAPYKDELYMHEYGHYMQSQEYGYGYLFSVGIPSIWDLAFKGGNDQVIINRKSYDKHDLKWFERNASFRGNKYFKGLYDSWNYIRYPIEDPR